MRQKTIFLITFLFIFSLSFTKEIPNFQPIISNEIKDGSVEDSSFRYKPEVRLVGSLFTRHVVDNDIYNNKSKLIGLEYRPIKDLGVSFAYFDNSFKKDSYALVAVKYFRPFDSFDKFYIPIGAGIVKGYRKENYIYGDNGEVLKKAKFNTNIGGDYIVGASAGVGYDITDYLSVNVSYVGAFIALISLKIY